MKAHTTTVSASSPQLLRKMNAQRVLEHMWDAEPTTATELIQATGLTRATVLALCRELTEQGWLEVVENARQAGVYVKGRPALRYAFRHEACFVIGVDAGQHRLSASVNDLRGSRIGAAQRVLDPRFHDADRHTGDERRQQILDVVQEALQDAAVPERAIGAVTLGVPAPVDVHGRSPAGVNDFWDRMNSDLASLGTQRGWDCMVENDANLAAVAELSRNPASADSSFAALLSGERMGAGIMVEGSLLRQRRGGAGELGMLELVTGVESTLGLGRWARELAKEGLREVACPAAAEGACAAAESPSSSQVSALAGKEAEQVTAQDVFSAADDGDALALQIMDALADRLARVCAVLTGLLDLDRIIVSGAVAPALHDVAKAAKEKLHAYIHAPWLEITASELGADAVREGAVGNAIERVRRRAFDGDASAVCARPSESEPAPA